MINNPLVSICIPTFNGERYILECLESALSQTYNNIEVIISDDLSTDSTIELIKKVSQNSSVPFIIHNHVPSGIGSNWNNCLKHANGDFIKFLFQDDILFPNCIEKLMEVFVNNPTVDLVASKRNILVNNDYISSSIKSWILKYSNLHEYLNPNNKGIVIIDRKILKNDVFFSQPHNKIGEPITTMFKKNIIERIGFYNVDLKQSLDYEYYYRILKTGKIALLNQELMSFRLHSFQATSVNNKNKLNERDVLLKSVFYNLFWEISIKMKVSLLKYIF